MEDEIIMEKIRGFLEDKCNLDSRACFIIVKQIEEQYWEDILQASELGDEDADIEDDEEEPEEDEDKEEDDEGMKKLKEIVRNRTLTKTKGGPSPIKVV